MSVHAREIAGSVALEVEHRQGGPAGGPTLRVCEEGRQRLRFDCFARGAHWHLDPEGRDEVTRLPAAVDAIDWTLDQLRLDLTGFLARAGARAELPDAGELRPVLDRVEAAMRNPPADFDSLDLDQLRQRRGEKWQNYPEDVLPLWVADMDFMPAEPIRRRLQRALDVGELGYPVHPAPTPLPEVFATRMRRLFDWSVDPRRVELLTEVVQGMYVALETFTEPGDGVIVQTPIYAPFLSCVNSMKRRLLENPLLGAADGYAVDLDGLRSLAPKARAILLCNPHNPTGRVFSRKELLEIAAIAEEHDLLVVSDEIHMELVYPDHRHIPFATLSPLSWIASRYSSAAGKVHPRKTWPEGPPST